MDILPVDKSKGSDRVLGIIPSETVHYTMPFLVTLFVLAGYIISSIVIDALVAITLGNTVRNSPDLTRAVEYRMLMMASRQLLGTVLILALMRLAVVAKDDRGPSATYGGSERRSLIRVAFVLEVALAWALLNVTGMVYDGIFDGIVEFLVDIFSPQDTGATPYQILYSPIAPQSQASPPGLLYYLLLFSIFVIFAPLFEELAFRKVMIPMMENRGYSQGAAVFFSSVFFAFFHTSRDIIDGSFSFALRHLYFTFFFGVVAAFLYIWTRDIRYPMVLHGLVNLQNVTYRIDYLNPLRPVFPVLHDILDILGIIYFVLLFLGGIYLASRGLPQLEKVRIFLPTMSGKHATWGWFGLFYVILFSVVIPILWYSVTAQVAPAILVLFLFLFLSGFALMTYLVFYKNSDRASGAEDNSHL